MREKILVCLLEWPGSRQREIASSLRVWLCDSTFLDTMHQLENDGLIKHTVHNDPANMEFYKKWYLTPAGYRLVMWVR